MAEPEKVPLVERLAYVLREWEESHATWAQQHINGKTWWQEQATRENPNPERQQLAPLKTECECQHCKDARVVLADYDAAGGDERAERIRY